MTLADLLRGFANMLDAAQTAEPRTALRCKVCRAPLEQHHAAGYAIGTARHPRVDDCPASGLDIPLSETEKG